MSRKEKDKVPVSLRKTRAASSSHPEANYEFPTLKNLNHRSLDSKDRKQSQSLEPKGPCTRVGIAMLIHRRQEKLVSGEESGLLSYVNAETLTCSIAQRKSVSDGGHVAQMLFI